MNNYDGYVLIGTKLDNKNLDKEIGEIENKLEVLRKKATDPYEVNGVKFTGGWNLTDEEQKEYDDLEGQLQKLEVEKYKLYEIERQITNELNNQKNIMSEKTLNTKDLTETEDINAKLREMVDNYRKMQNQDIISSQDLKEAEELKNNIIRTAKEIEKISGQKISIKGITDIGKDIDEVGKKHSNVIQKIGKWSLAIFSVRTAYNLISKATSTLTQYNEELSNKLESIQLIAASALEPIINRLVNLVYTLLSYVNYLANAWFKINLFASANDKILKNSNKTAKEMKKTLTGFDEMNVLQDTSNSSNASSNTSISMPEDVKIPKWLEWIKDNGSFVAVTLSAIGTALLGIKIGKFITSATKLASGFALILAGVVALSGSIVYLISNWDNLTTKEKVLTISLGVVGAAFIALGYSIATGLSVATLGIGAIIAVIVALVTALISLIAKWSKEETAIKDVATAQEELKNAQDEYANAQDEYITAVDKATEAFNKLNDIQNETGISGEDLYKKVQDGTLDYANMTEQQKEVYKAYLDNINAQDNLKKSTENLTEAKKEEKIKTWEAKLAQEAQNETFAKGGESAQKFKEDVINAYKSGELSAEEARDLIGKSMSEMGRDTQKVFTEDLPDSIKEGLDPKKYETTGQKFKKFFDGIWESMKSGASTAWNWITSKFSGNKSSSNSSSGFAKGGIVYSNVPKLASGGIINIPGQGVPIVSAIGGERGKEGVIPLTDSQQMALLGEAIGRYITVNLTNINEMNGRVLSREMKRINNDSDFLFNR